MVELEVAAREGRGAEAVRKRPTPDRYGPPSCHAKPRTNRASIIVLSTDDQSGN
jgi:hypothetical protein